MNLIELIDNLNLILTPTTNVINAYTIISSYNNDDWKKYIIKTDNYVRNLIYRNDSYEIFLIIWSKNAETKIHNHPLNGCLLKILEGTLIESYPNTFNTKILKVDDISYIDHNMYHSIKSLDNSYSLHIYSPPLFYN